MLNRLIAPHRQFVSVLAMNVHCAGEDERGVYRSRVGVLFNDLLLITTARKPVRPKTVAPPSANHVLFFWGLDLGMGPARVPLEPWPAWAWTRAGSHGSGGLSYKRSF